MAVDKSSDPANRKARNAPPSNNLPGQSQQWARWVEGVIRGVSGAADSAAKNSRVVARAATQSADLSARVVRTSQDTQFQLSALRDNVTYTEEEVAESRVRLQDAEEKLVIAEGKLADAEGRLADAEADLADAEGRLDLAEGRLTDAEADLAEADGRLTGAEGRLTGAEGRLTSAEGRLTGAEGKLDDAEGELDDLATRIQVAEDEIQTIINNPDGTQTVYSTSTPSGTNFNEGSTWYRHAATNQIIGQWRFNGSSWTQVTLAHQVIASVDAGKITTGYLAGDRIEANTITSNQITTGDLVGLSITGSDITGNTITGGDITGTTITGGDITGTNITGSDITGNTITGGDITGANITGSDIVGNTITGGDITGTTITGGDITGTTITGGDITGTNITGADITGTTITGGDIVGTTVTGATITGTTSVTAGGSLVVDGNVIFRDGGEPLLTSNSEGLALYTGSTDPEAPRILLQSVFAPEFDYASTAIRAQRWNGTLWNTSGAIHLAPRQTRGGGATYFPDAAIPMLMTFGQDAGEIQATGRPAGSAPFGRPDAFLWGTREPYLDSQNRPYLKGKRWDNLTNPEYVRTWHISKTGDAELKNVTADSVATDNLRTSEGTPLFKRVYGQAAAITQSMPNGEFVLNFSALEGPNEGVTFFDKGIRVSEPGVYAVDVSLSLTNAPTTNYGRLWYGNISSNPYSVMGSVKYFPLSPTTTVRLTWTEHIVLGANDLVRIFGSASVGSDANLAGSSRFAVTRVSP